MVYLKGSNQIDILWDSSNLTVVLSFEFYEFSPLPAYQILDHSSEVGCKALRLCARLPFLRPELCLSQLACTSLRIPALANH